MANTFGFAVLFLWPFLSALAFCRLPLAAGTSAAVIGGYLFLPARISVNLPIIPTFDKELSAVTAAIAVVLLHKALNPQRLRSYSAQDCASRPGWLPSNFWIAALVIMFVLSPLPSALTNRSPLVFDLSFLPGLSLYDAFSGMLGSAVIILPFLMGRKYMACPKGQRTLLAVLAVCAAVYMLPTLFEVRMSPQLSRWIYGFFPHSFAQHMRGGGFRPVVFLEHGLLLALFLSAGVISAAGCARIFTGLMRAIFAALAFALFVTLVLTKSLGALLITLAFLPFAIFAGRNVQIFFAASIACLVLLYPALRTSAIFPASALTNAAALVNEQRAGSLSVRLHHEEELVEKAMRKPLFGWGGWGRWRVHDEAGRDVTVSDGRWVITLGEGGWVRFIGLFGLLSAPIIFSCTTRLGPRVGLEHSTIALLLAANMIDLVPNSGMTVITWLLAGSLAGRLELERAGATISTTEKQEATPQLRGALAYTRFSPMSERGSLSDRMDRQQREKQPSRMTDTDAGPIAERYTRFASSTRVRIGESDSGTTAGSLLRGQRGRPVSEIHRARKL